MQTATAAQLLPQLWEFLARVPTTTPGFPSWAPDFNNNTDSVIGKIICHAFDKDVLEAFRDAARLRSSPESGVIFLKVLELEVVTIPGVKACPASDAKPSDLEVAETLSWFKCVHETLFSSGDGPFTVMLRELFSSTNNVDEKPEYYLNILMLASQLFVEDIALDDAILRVAQEMNSESDRKPVVESDASPGFKKLKGDLTLKSFTVQNKYSGIHAFLAEGGRLGRSPKPVCPGDRICIGPGGNLLHIFSDEVPSRYITCASVHGFMGDNLLDIVRELGREFEEIATH